MHRFSPSKRDGGTLALFTAAADSSTEPAADSLRRYRLVASAIAGRAVEVAPVVAGEAAWSDGVTIFISADVDPRRQLAMLVVQSSLLGAGSLDTTVLAALSRRPALARRYLAVEGHRALSRHEHLLPTSVRPMIDHTIAGRTTSPNESLAIAGSRQPLDEAPETFGMIQPRRVEASAVAPEDRDALHQHVPRRADHAQLRELDGDDEEDDASAAEMLPSPVGGGGGIGRLLKKLLGDARAKGDGPPGADAPTHWTRRSNPTARTHAVSTTTAPAPEGTAHVERQGITYPEWDRNKRRYKLDWCTVEEIDPPVSELAPFRPADTQRLRRALGRLGMEFQRYHRQLQGDDIDVDAAVEAHVDLRAGSVPDEAVYIETLRRRRDVSVLLLLDVSGSAGEPSATSVPVHEHQRSAAGALAVALHELGDRVALYGFRSQGRAAVHILPIMRFGDDPDALVGGLVPGAYTRLGAAIRHGAAILEQDAGTARRLLVVLSDGFAYDHGYERSYGEADARRALSEARRRGIGCLCLSIGAATDIDALRRVFGSAAHAGIPRVELLPTVVGPLFRAALRSAELQWRVFQRRERTRERLGVERRTA